MELSPVPKDQVNEYGAVPPVGRTEKETARGACPDEGFATGDIAITGTAEVLLKVVDDWVVELEEVDWVVAELEEVDAVVGAFTTTGLREVEAVCPLLSVTVIVGMK